jgi:hypothetical protein
MTSPLYSSKISTRELKKKSCKEKRQEALHLEGVADAQPDGEVEARLRPGEDPGDGAQLINAAAAGAQGKSMQQQSTG